jgi:hypothetical protein
MSERFLIEVPHDSSMSACVSAVEIFLKTGSHFLTHADWGCKDGVHKAWMVVDVDSRDEAKAIIPPLYRQQATIVRLNEFTIDEIENLRRHIAK